MIYFRPIEDFEKTKSLLYKKTDGVKKGFLHTYDNEGFYSKVYKNCVHIMYVDEKQAGAAKGGVYTHFYGCCVRYNDRQYLLGVFCLDLSLLLCLLAVALFGILIFDFEEAGFAILFYIFLLVLDIKSIKVLRDFLVTL